MKFLSGDDWAFMAMNTFGILCLVYVAYCITSNVIYNRRVAAYKLRQLQDYVAKASKDNQNKAHLLEHARARELELTEERNILRNRAALFARIIKEDDICSEKKLTQIIGRVTRLWKLPCK